MSPVLRRVERVSLWRRAIPMSWLRRKPDLVKIHVPSRTDCGYTLAVVPADVVAVTSAFQQRINNLETEAQQTAIATKAMAETARREAERQQRRINALVEERQALRTAFTNKQREVDLALAEIKRLDAALVQADAANLQLHGELATAYEQIAGLKLVTS